MNPLPRHYYYSAAWQSLEERLDDSTDPDRQFVWGLRYIDDLVLRDRDPLAGGTLTERLYALQDANWNMIAICDPSGDIQERYAYTAYGVPLFLSPQCVPQAASNYDWETLYCSYRYDAATGIYKVRYRDLQSSIGTWLTRDPVQSDANPYLYVLNSPIQLTDPSGKYPGTKGHGTIISPVDSNKLITTAQASADSLFEKVRASRDLWPAFLTQELDDPTTSYLGNAFRLGFIGIRIGTGGGNRFVFTCKYGWIDHGHFLNNALITYLAGLGYAKRGVSEDPNSLSELGRFTAWGGSLINELLQQVFGSDSAWTREDVVSNKLGRDLGVAMLKNDLIGIGLAQKQIANPFNGAIIKPGNQPLALGLMYNVADHWRKLLVEAGAVSWSDTLTTCGKTPHEQMQVEGENVRKFGAPKSHSVQESLTGYRESELWKCLCDGDLPKKPEHRYKGE